MSSSLFQRKPVMALLILALFFLSFVLSSVGYWLFIPIPAAIVGGLLHHRASRTLLCVGLPVLLATLLSILFTQPGYKFAETGLVASIAGIPGGAYTLLLMTILIAFLLGLIAGLAGKFFADILLKNNDT